MPASRRNFGRVSCLLVVFTLVIACSSDDDSNSSGLSFDINGNPVVAGQYVLTANAGTFSCTDGRVGQNAAVPPSVTINQNGAAIVISSSWWPDISGAVNIDGTFTASYSEPAYNLEGVTGSLTMTFTGAFTATGLTGATEQTFDPGGGVTCVLTADFTGEKLS